ncbi:MAG: hypothetical protein UX75_C0004G0035 [Candidatus Moranbacteria bacterium GW2011_GWE2_47_10]|nr:MAG: hypothetical protein UX75_C0004G0035 [Candidatus Moranbacteria bacterium GW2011_GWE2_47_10]
MIKKEEVGKTLVIAWFIIATLYVGYDLWSDYKVKGIDAAYKAGVSNTVNQLIEQTEKSQCQSFEVFSGDKKVQLLDAQCVQQQPATEPAQEDKK